VAVTLRPAVRFLPLCLTALALAVPTASAARSSVPPLLFPVVGAVTFRDDFGEPRGGLRHQGNDLVGDRRAPVVAVEDGTVKYWTTSASAGCMLYLYGSSGTMYEYIHLNNDLTPKNDNKGKCVQGTAYAVPDGTPVVSGQVIGYLGDSGDADGIHPHLHFEVHPNGGKAVDPYPFIRKAPHPLVGAPPVGRGFTLKLTGTIVDAGDLELTLSVDTLASWPSHLKQKQLNRELTLTVPDPTAVAEATPGARVVVWTRPAPGTVEALTGAPDAITLDRLALR
jgi:Peptidase family M23